MIFQASLDTGASYGASKCAEIVREREGTGGTTGENMNIRFRPTRKLQVFGSGTGRWDLSQGSV